MSFFTRPGQEVIGVDISDHIIRAAVLQHDRSHARLVAHAQTEMAEGTIERGVVQSEDNLVDALKQLMKYLSRHKGRASVVAGLPEYHGFINTTIQTAKTKKREIEKHLPFPYDEVRIDAYSQQLQKNNLTQKLLSFGAVRKETAEMYERIWKRVGVHTRALEIESQSLARLYFDHTTPNDTATVICDLGQNHMTFVLMQQGHIDFTYTSRSISGKLLTKNIAASMGIQESEAKKMKDSAASIEDVASLGAAVDEFTVMIATELDRVVSFHQTHPVAEVSRQYKVLFTGGASLLPGFTEKLGKQTGLTCSLAMVPEHVRLPKKFTAQHAYNTALGHALRPIDK